MQNDIYLIGEVGYDITLESVINQVKQTNQSMPLYVNIHSIGGSVYDGLAIYNYLKNLPQDVYTRSSGLVASIASIIFLAGKKENRTINRSDNYLIHLPMGGANGNAEDLEKTANELRDIEQKLAIIYENETNLSKDQALELMKKDEMLNVDFLKENGFVSEIIEFQAVATLKRTVNNNKIINNKMEVTKEEASVLSKFFPWAFSNKKEEDKQVAKKVLNTIDNQKLSFSNLDEDAKVNIGDEATLTDDKNNETKPNGDVQLQNKDVLVFNDGKVEDIQKFQEEQSFEDVKTEIMNEFSDKFKELTDKIEDQNKIINEFSKFTNSFKNITIKNSVDTKEERKEEINKTNKKSGLSFAKTLNKK